MIKAKKEELADLMAVIEDDEDMDDDWDVPDDDEFGNIYQSGVYIFGRLFSTIFCYNTT